MASAPLVSERELRSFMRDGYLIKRGCLDPSLLQPARDRMWEMNEVPRLQRDEPESWLQPFVEHEQSPADQNQRSAGAGSGGAVSGGRSWRLRAVGAEELFLDLLPRAVFPIAEELCGAGTLVWPDGATQKDFTFGHPGGNYAGKGTAGQALRGVYNVLPSPLDVPRNNIAQSAHVDGWAGDRWRVSCHAYLEDVTPGGGGFGVRGLPTP